YYQHVLGDKATYHLAWRRLDQPYSMPPYPPRQLTGPARGYEPGLPVLVGLEQHDFEGRAIFHHRPGAKWTAWGENVPIAGFPYEAACLEALHDLARRWDGRVSAPPAASS